jgi:hypothetical protein
MTEELIMCAINAKHERYFVISVYTSVEMGDKEFKLLIAQKMVEIETQLNKDMRLRWHVKETEELKMKTLNTAQVNLVADYYSSTFKRATDRFKRIEKEMEQDGYGREDIKAVMEVIKDRK